MKKIFFTILEKSKNLFRNIFTNFRFQNLVFVGSNKVKKYKLISTISGFSSLVSLFLCPKITEKSEEFGQFWGLFVFITLVSWLYFKYKIFITKTENLKQYKVKEYKYLEAAYNEYSEQLKRYEEQARHEKDSLDAYVSDENRKVGNENKEIEKYNKEIESQIIESQENLKFFLNNLKEKINDYLDSHPKIQEFLPKV